MKKDIIKTRKSLKTGFQTTTYEGEKLENKVSRILENNEPISDGVQLSYTKRSDGVKPELDIRTDKWDLALDKMQYVNESKKNKIKESMINKGMLKEEEKEEKGKEGEVN